MTEEPKFQHRCYGMTFKIGPFTREEWDRMAAYYRSMSIYLEETDDPDAPKYLLPEHLVFVPPGEPGKETK